MTLWTLVGGGVGLLLAFLVLISRSGGGHIAAIAAFPVLGPVAACLGAALGAFGYFFKIRICHPSQSSAQLRPFLSILLPMLTCGAVIYFSAIATASVSELFYKVYFILLKGVLSGAAVWMLLRIKGFQKKTIFLLVACLTVIGFMKLFDKRKPFELGPVFFSVTTSDGQPVSDAVILAFVLSAQHGSNYFSEYFVTDSFGCVTMPRISLKIDPSAESANEFVTYFKGIDYTGKRPAHFERNEYYAFPDDSYGAVENPETHISLERNAVPERIDFHLKFSHAEYLNRKQSQK
jgi:hypothetical protein